eukprot:TRINITY_DN8118_c0_g1_i1.p1 TRINITY_DN8118_c0_g1~~TRINITY_DN8118_c0_g1_i1.p1  ORF type:complete len:950 (+),score=183.40 TRINITY_DN8118_c0_g1_i1:141-2990(+)
MLSSSTDMWSRAQTTLNAGMPSTLLGNAFGNFANGSPAASSNTAPSWSSQPLAWRQPNLEKIGSGSSSRSSSASSNAEGPSQVLDASGQSRPTRPPRPPCVSRRPVPATDRVREEAAQFRGDTEFVNEPRPSSTSSASSEDFALILGTPPAVRPGRCIRVPRPSKGSADDSSGACAIVTPHGAASDEGVVPGSSALPAYSSGGATGSTTLPCRDSSSRVDSGGSSLPCGVVGLATALGEALQETLELKYGVAIEVADFIRKVEGHCCGDATLRGGRQDDTMQCEAAVVPGEFRSALAELAAQLNSRQDLRFQVRDTDDTLLALRVDFAECEFFEELLGQVRQVQGTARSLAIVSIAETEKMLLGGCAVSAPASSPTSPSSAQAPVSTSAASVTTALGGSLRLQAVAVFRTDYGDPTMLVGRCKSKGLSPLVSFRKEAFYGGLAIDPTITAVFSRGEGVVLEAIEGSNTHECLPLRPEYLATVRVVSVTKTASAPKPPWRELPEAELFEASSEGSAPAPGQRWMRRFRKAFESTDFSAESQLALLQQLEGWLEGSADIAAAARRAFTDASLQGPVVDYLRWASAAGGRWRTELAVASQACRVIGLTSRDFPEGAAAFFKARAASTLCGLMRRWLSNGAVQLGAVFALRILLEEDPHGPIADSLEASKAAQQQAAQQAQQLVRAAMATHPRLGELMSDGSIVVQLLSLSNRDQSESPSAVSSASSTSGRKGIATALMERRAADAAKPGVVSAAVGWLFSGSREWNQKNSLKGTAEPPGSRSGHMAPPPEPFAPLALNSTAPLAMVASVADAVGAGAVGALGLPAAAAAALPPSPAAAMLANGGVVGGATTPIGGTSVGATSVVGAGVAGGATVHGVSTQVFNSTATSPSQAVVRPPPAFGGTTVGSEPLSPRSAPRSAVAVARMQSLDGLGDVDSLCNLAGSVGGGCGQSH